MTFAEPWTRTCLGPSPFESFPARLPTAGGAHGSGCVLSAAICAELARGMEAPDACVAAKRFVERAIAAGPVLGDGVVPVDPGWATR